MSDYAIKVENLGKSYRIGQGQSERYYALRDVLAKGTRDFFSHLLNGKNPLNGTEQAQEFWALKDVSFEVKHGEVLGIIGRNGAGKSTLLKLLGRITEPTEGRITINGRVASLLEVGTGFHPELTGRENILLSGAILGMRRQEIRKKFDEIVDFAGVEKFLDTPVKRYSSGMYVRLGFAVAAHLEPEILLVDEVLAVGDAEFQKRCLGKMQKISEAGRTILFVSHDLDSIRRLCNKALVVNQGSILLTTEPETCIRYYLTSIGNNTLKAINKLNGYYSTEVSVLADGDCKAEFYRTTRVTLQIKIKSNDPIINPVVGIVIKDSTMKELIGVNNIHYGKKFNVQFSSALVSIELGKLPFSPGDYSIDFYLGDFSGDKEVIENGIRFRLIDDGKVKLNKKLNKIVIDDIQWKLSKV